MLAATVFIVACSSGEERIEYQLSEGEDGSEDMIITIIEPADVTRRNTDEMDTVTIRSFVKLTDPESAECIEVEGASREGLLSGKAIRELHASRGGDAPLPFTLIVDWDVMQASASDDSTSEPDGEQSEEMSLLASRMFSLQISERGDDGHYSIKMATTSDTNTMEGTPIEGNDHPCPLDQIVNVFDVDSDGLSNLEEANNSGLGLNAAKDDNLPVNSNTDTQPFGYLRQLDEESNVNRPFGFVAQRSAGPDPLIDATEFFGLKGRLASTCTVNGRACDSEESEPQISLWTTPPDTLEILARLPYETQVRADLLQPAASAKFTMVQAGMTAMCERLEYLPGAISPRSDGANGSAAWSVTDDGYIEYRCTLPGLSNSQEPVLGNFELTVEDAGASAESRNVFTTTQERLVIVPISGSASLISPSR